VGDPHALTGGLLPTALGQKRSSTATGCKQPQTLAWTLYNAWSGTQDDASRRVFVVETWT
jgi:hypothetical protein